MSATEVLLYAIILGLVVNLLANMIWKYMSGTDKNVDKIVTGALVFICILFLIFSRTDSATTPNASAASAVVRMPNSGNAELITRSEWNMLGGSTGKTLPVKVIANDGKIVQFQMPMGTLNCPLDPIDIVAVQGRVIRIH